MVALGIDLGTGFARAAVFRDREPELLQFPDGAHSVPAVVSVHDGSMRVGRPALARAASHPKDTVRGIKRFLGRPADDPVTQRLAERVAFALGGSSRAPLVLRLGNREYEPEDLAAALLRHIAGVAGQHVGEHPSGVVLSTPYWYGTRQRHALSDAAKRAGLTVLQVISEATATALSLIDADPGERKVAIVDVGAGGCTASIIELSPNRVRLIASAGDPLGGGEDVDYGLARAVLKGLRARLGDFPDDPAVNEMVRQVCEGAKRDLAEASAVSAVIPFLPVDAGVFDQRIDVDREGVSRLMSDTTLRVGSACRTALEESGVGKSELAAIYATGGMTRLAVVREAIESALGEISSRRLDPDGSVALGAAYQGGMLQGMADSIPVIDVQTSLSMPPPAPGGVSLPPAQVASNPPPAVRSSRPAPSARKGPVDKEAFRLELAGLLASLRAGALSDGGSARRRHIVARGTEVVEDDGDLTEEQLAENVTRLGAIWKQIATAMQTARQYRWDHPQTDKVLSQVVSMVADAVAIAPSSIRWDVGSMHFAHRDAVVWKPDRPPYDRIPYDLFADGIRKIQLKAGLTVDELKRLLGVLLRDRALGFGADDDAATAMWDAKLSFVAYSAVDAFTEADDPTFETRRDDLVAKLSEIAELGGDDVLGAYVAARREIAPLVDAAALDEATYDDLTSRIDSESDEWSRRYARAFAEAYAVTVKRDGAAALLRTLDDWTAAQIAARAPAGTFELVDSLGGAFDERWGGEAGKSFRRSAGAVMFPPDRLVTVYEDFREDDEPPAAVADGLAGVLERLADDQFVASSIELCQALASDRLRQDLTRYVTRFVAGHEREIGRLLADAAPEDAIPLLETLRAIGTPEALAATHDAVQSPHVEVRLEALAGLSDEPAELLREDVRRIVEDPEPEVRLAALASIKERKIVLAGPVLVLRVRSNDFHALSLDERRQLLEAVRALNPSRADELAIALLQDEKLIKSESVEQSRELAAEFLGESDSAAALEALTKASKKRLFGRASSVRVAAERAAASVTERRSQRPVPRDGGAK